MGAIVRAQRQEAANEEGRSQFLDFLLDGEVSAISILLPQTSNRKA